ncbi:hypothetical protein RJ640_010617 [Escallonia rubra]|uniref:DYW domain-containing protein n=1 Tax=Escallonia rubra TaxID=112253 RepID=A0AA88SE59_9ASTE|nr:hypothetical protein RJ640_010617 [Escallonia rubra]
MRPFSAHHPPLSPLNTHHHLSLSSFATQALQLHHSPPFSESPPKKYQTEIKLISLIKSTPHKPHLLQIHAHLIRTSFLRDPTISFTLLTRLALPPLRDLRYSRQIFAQIPTPNISHYSAMIRAHSVSNDPTQGFYLYREMLRRCVRSDPVVSSFVTKCLVKIPSLFGGLQIHARVLRDGYRLDSLLMTTLMELYSSCERFSDACKVFDEMSDRDTVAWNVLISCYSRNGRSKDALGIFDVMRSLRCEPDDVTCLLLLQACANLGTLEFGERVHEYLIERGYEDSHNLCNTLVKMYTKCGCLEKAYQVFKSMSNKDVVTWSAMISGLASNGHGRDALEAFGEMQKMGVAPDDHTFTGVLSACSHCGLLDEGRMFFDLMKKKYGIAPNIHHYGCMVDLMGRVGLLDDAYKLIANMRVKPDATIWRTLLGGCRIHGCVDLGERAIEHLIELKAQEAGDYVLLLNMYSSAGNWEKVIEVRKLMKEKGIITTPGCSTMELNGGLHEFIADDISHPRKHEIYEMLDEIGKQLKIAGYVAEITSEMHNLDPEEKQTRLTYHSEKLAIAFGVLSTPPGRTIRVAKNLRTCVDCHNFAKILSSVYNREVIIRDRSRFHHFRDGHCSCKDYW